MRGPERIRDLESAVRRSFDATSSSIAPARNFVVEGVAAVLGSDRLDDVELASSELVTNAIVHGDGDAIAVELLVTATGGNVQHVCVAVTSTTLGRTVADPDQWSLPEDPLAHSGRGLFLVAATSDHVSVEHHGDLITVIACFAASPSTSAFAG